MMSEKERKVVISVEQLYALMNAIKDELDGLRVVQAQLTDLLERVRKAKESIDAIVLSKDENLLLPLEPGALVLSSMRPVDRENFIVNVGLDVYVKLGANEAQRVLSKRESEILKRLEEVTQKVNELSQAYEQYQTILQAAVAQAQMQGRTSGQRSPQGS